MNHLRWGRFHSQSNNLVWIELRKEGKKQWLWLNGEKITDCNIEDEIIESADSKFVLELDKSVVLESEKKIFNVVEKILRNLPGFKQLMPSKFLLAHNQKWLSNCTFQHENKPQESGRAIHEWVNFDLSRA